MLILTDEGAKANLSWPSITAERATRRVGLLQRYFASHGRFCAKYPARILAFSVLVVALLGIGIFNLESENDPRKLWISPSSQSFLNQQYFFDYFTDFREEMIIVTNKIDGAGVIDYDILQEVLSLQLAIMNINITLDVRVKEKKMCVCRF